MRTWRRSTNIHHVRHRIGNSDPSLRADFDLSHFTVAIRNLNVLRGKLVWKCDVRTNKAAVTGYGSDGAGKLNWICRYRALSDTHGNHFTCKPFLMEYLRLPLFRRHYARGFLRKVDARFLANPELVGVFRNPLNP